MEEIINTPAPEETVEVVDIQFRPGQKIYYFDPAGFACKPGDHVIIDTARGAEYGICAPRATAKSMLYYIPILVMLTANLWYGVSLNFSAAETVLYILAMLCVGLLEELIFRGLLFEAMRGDSLKAAVIISSVTFGIGHIINLVNGSGTELLPNLLQVVYATAAGFMFVMMYLRSKSLVVCIAAHGLFNALGAFANESATTNEMRVLSAILLTLITGSYAAYLALSMKGKNS